MVELKGGAKLDALLAKYSSKQIQNASVEVGFQDGATEADGTPVALVAALNEYGVPSNNQPPRPFMRRAIAANQKKWAKNLGTALVNTDYDMPKSFALVGLRIKEDIEDSIQKLVSPPLAEATIAKKGFDKPLIDSSTMSKRVTYMVKS